MLKYPQHRTTVWPRGPLAARLLAVWRSLQLRLLLLVAALPATVWFALQQRWWLALACLLAGGGLCWQLSHTLRLAVAELIVLANRVRDGVGGEAELSHHRELSELSAALQQMQQAIAAREQSLREQACRDPLTGLFNRLGFSAHLEQRLRQPGTVSLLRLGLGRLQQVNATLGYDAGDDILRQFARRLEARVLPWHGVVGRLGGDEYAVLLDGDEVSLQAVLEVMRTSLDELYLVDGRHLDVRACIGLASAPLHAGDATGLLRCADEAMSMAKQQYLPLVVYAPDWQRQREQRLALLDDLRLALERGELQLFYQPKVTLKTGLTHEAEALLRWQHPQRGFVAPDEFLPYAEQTGYVRELTRWVIAGVCRDVSRLWQDGLSVRVSLNLFASDLLDAGLTGYLQHCLHENGLPADLLCLELTERGLLVESAPVQRSLHVLREMGFALAVDDYGKGYSSLASLRRLPVSELKIDRSFVKMMTSSQPDLMLVRAMIDMAHSLGLATAAVGVEDLKTAQSLLELGCDAAQGYYFSWPVSFEAFRHWLQHQQRLASPRLGVYPPGS